MQHIIRSQESVRSLGAMKALEEIWNPRNDREVGEAHYMDKTGRGSSGGAWKPKIGAKDGSQRWKSKMGAKTHEMDPNAPISSPKSEL